jgi:hypothetical protein
MEIQIYCSRFRRIAITLPTRLALRNQQNMVERKFNTATCFSYLTAMTAFFLTQFKRPSPVFTIFNVDI